MSEQTSEQTNIPEFTDKDKREPVFHNFDDQPEVVGKLIAVEQGAYGDQLRIRTDKGEIVIGSYDVLKSKVTSSDVGKFLKIVFSGNKISPKTRRTYKDFVVYVK